MYKILVVDGNVQICNDIGSCISESGFENEVYEVSDYKSVLAYIKDYNIDVLVVDVSTHEEYLKRIDELRSCNRYIKIVIMHNEPNFEYAIYALRNGFSDYWTKPLDESVMYNTFVRLFREIDEVRRETHINTRTSEYLVEHMVYLAINGASFQEIEQYSENTVDLTFMKEYCCMMMIDFNKGFFDRKGNDFKIGIVEKLPGKVTYLNLNHAQSILLFSDNEENYIDTARYIVNKIRQEYEEECFVAVSTEFNGYSGIAVAMEELDTLIENKFYHKTGEVFFRHTTGTRNDFVTIDDDTIMKQIKQDIRMCDVNGIRAHFENFASKYSNRTDFSQLYIKFLFASLLKELTCNVAEMDEQDLNAEVDALYRANEFESVVAVINRNIDRLEEYFGKMPNEGHQEIKIVKEYIQEHYGEEISVEKLGKMVFMSPSYLSYIFKKETGQNLSKYIKTYRMDRAKFMLENTDSKIVDISNECGYPNVSYFCSSFREYFGISPQKYRENGDENTENDVY